MKLVGVAGLRSIPDRANLGGARILSPVQIPSWAPCKHYAICKGTEMPFGLHADLGRAYHDIFHICLDRILYPIIGYGSLDRNPSSKAACIQTGKAPIS